ncbi:flagellar hook-basal body complex protein FliE [Sphingomonas oryzagri]|uniref:Flagellar hook-basal body complex protein FliE n=1 Tax=Sphingomonas oryzagri TaxID=3042314 RepID=A0ABT6N4S0_9SPHN|nr:flagellar hook-basal body complex protein FliE [Sphingomonas oryzagri]MDH7639621.1 flagellar hook-basal body complex protein FliE [Sphingomonas oryzagri]
MTTINASNLMALRNQILQQNSALQKAAASGPQSITDLANTAPTTGTQASAQGIGGTDFGATLKGVLNQVNAAQSKAEDLSVAYERGETTDIASVMMAREKASVGFQATLQVRNKLLSAYKDIMSMSV